MAYSQPGYGGVRGARGGGPPSRGRGRGGGLMGPPANGAKIEPDAAEERPPPKHYTDDELREMQEKDPHIQSIKRYVLRGVPPSAEERDDLSPASLKHIRDFDRLEYRNNMVVRRRRPPGSEVDEFMPLRARLDGDNSSVGPAIKQFCEICQCSVTRAEELAIHLKGVRHLKNLKNRAMGESPCGGRPGAKSKKANEQKIEDVLNSCTRALIGLSQLDEVRSTVQNEHNSYWCKICCSRFDIAGAVPHLTGRTHRTNYMKQHYPEYHADVVTLEANKEEQTTALEKYAQGIMLSEGRGKHNVVTKNITNIYTQAIPSMKVIDSKLREKGIINAEPSKRGQPGDYGPAAKRGRGDGGSWGDPGGRGAGGFGRGGSSDRGGRGGFGDWGGRGGGSAKEEVERVFVEEGIFYPTKQWKRSLVSRYRNAFNIKWVTKLFNTYRNNWRRIVVIMGDGNADRPEVPRDFADRVAKKSNPLGFKIGEIAVVKVQKYLLAYYEAYSRDQDVSLAKEEANRTLEANEKGQA